MERFFSTDGPAAGDRTSGEWIEHTRTYQNYLPLGAAGVGVGGTITEYLESDDFNFDPTPGSIEVIINSASFDDKGTIGGIESTTGRSCNYANTIAGPIPVPEANVEIIGKRLRVSISATDDPACANHIGWPYNGPEVSITWRAKCSDACAQGACEPGSLSATLGSVDVSMGLGRDRFGQAAGQLAIRTNFPGATLAQPAGLRAFLGAGVEKITNAVNGELRQVRTSQVLADIVVSNNYCYQVRFYTAANFSTNKVAGVYPPTGQPFQIITVENPETNTVNKLRLSTTGALGEREYQYEYFPADNCWELTRAGGLVKESRAAHWVGDVRIETNEVRHADGTLVAQQVEKYRVFPWGATNLVERIMDPAGAALTNRWIYYDDPDSGSNYRRLQYRIEPTGYWERYEYDSAGRITKIVKQFGNAPTNAPENECRVTDRYHWGDWSGRYEYLQDYLVGWEESWRTTASRTDRRYTDEWGTALETVTSWHTNGAFDAQTRSIRQPDGTWSVFTYALSADGQTKITTNDVGAGVLTEYTYDAAGRLIATFRNGVMISSNRYDLAGRLTSTTDALGQTTTYSESFNATGELVKTTTYPDGSTRIETYYQDGQLKSVTGTAVRGVKYDYGVEQESGVYRRYVKETKLNTEGTETTEWTKTYYDMLDRAYKTVYADGSYSQRWYNNKGQLWKEQDPDGVVTLYAYNDLGEVETTAVDMNHNNTIDYAGADRITIVRSSVAEVQGSVCRRTTTTVYTTAGTENTETVVLNNVAVDGSRAWQIQHGLTNHTATSINRNTATKTITTTAPDGSYTVSVTVTGRLVSVTRYDANHTPIATTTYQYGAHGRQKSQTTAFGNSAVTTAFAYNHADQLIAITNAVGLTEQQVTRYFYDPMGRRSRTILPDGAEQFTAYYPTGEVATNWGARTYPVAYTYDYAGRMKTMTTWQNFAGRSGAATTTWTYDPQRGFLTAKVYADQSSVTYSNTPAGRLAKRTWARGVTTDYTYNNAGELVGITYSDATPAVAAVYDRRGRRVAVTNGAAVATYTFNAAGQLLVETHTAGPLAGLSITNTYDSLQRRSSLHSSLSLPPSTFSYDAASRLATVGQASLLATYSYLPNSSLVSNNVFVSGGTNVMTTTKTYDALQRLVAITTFNAQHATLIAHRYDYNAANQRTRRTEADGSHWDYT